MIVFSLRFFNLKKITNVKKKMILKIVKRWLLFV